MLESVGGHHISPLLARRPSNDTSSTLPVHVARHREEQRRRSQSQSLSTSVFELETLNEGHKIDREREGNKNDGHPLSDSDSDFDLDSDQGEAQAGRGLLIAESSRTQMQRNGRKQKNKKSPSRLDLSKSASASASASSSESVVRASHDLDSNGHAQTNGDMIEHRRKHGGGSAPNDAAVKAAAMRRADFSLDNEPPMTPSTPNMVETSFSSLPPSDKRAFMLLCLLYFLQGVPMGLAVGSVPFLLKQYLSYGQIGVFSLAVYPYSLKLLWSPIVDAVWSPKLGRRKSWILPIQTVSGFTMIYLGSTVDAMMEAAGGDGDAGVWNFTIWWFMLVFLCATQDIAVDGWAISLISVQNISYASSAQTVGLTAGAFLSHTVFLALQGKDFANRWVWSTPKSHGLISLGGYMTFWGWAYLIVTAGLAVFKKEDKTKERDGIKEVYQSMWAVLKLKNIITICIIHLISKLGFVTNEAVTNLKLLDKGFGQANLALVVLIDFPFEIGLGYYAGQWSTKYTPLRLWCWAFVARLVAAVFAQITLMIYPSGLGPDDGIPLWYMLVVIASHIYSTFMSTVMFVAVSAFHARIADPAIGGTYMTLLATVSNLGGTFPKFFILKLVDVLTVATCTPPTDVGVLDKLKADAVSPVATAFSCALEADKHRCEAGGGTCVMHRDGYYFTNIIFVILGAVTFWMFIEKRALALQALPLRAWRVVLGGDQGAYSRISN